MADATFSALLPLPIVRAVTFREEVSFQPLLYERTAPEPKVTVFEESITTLFSTFSTPFWVFTPPAVRKPVA